MPVPTQDVEVICPIDAQTEEELEALLAQFRCNYSKEELEGNPTFCAAHQELGARHRLLEH